MGMHYAAAAAAAAAAAGNLIGSQQQYELVSHCAAGPFSGSFQTTGILSSQCVQEDK